MIDKFSGSGYGFNPAFLAISSIFVISTFLIFTCLWFRKTFSNFCPDHSFKGLDENEECYFNDISISTVPRVSFPLQPEVHVQSHSYERNFSLPYNDPVSFEPIPKLVSKKSAPSADDLFSQLRPRIAKIGFKLPTAASELKNELDIIKNISDGSFPRSQLQYIKELGVTKLAKVLQAEAYNIQPGRKRSHVTVVMIDASTHPTHQATLLREALSYREIKHVNVMRFYCLCTDSDPPLAIYESFNVGDLKTYLRSHRSDMQAFLNQGVILTMICDISAGLQALHQMDYVHRDLALRNCMLSNDMVVKIGDYGLSEQRYRDDYYYNTNDDDVGIPLRWMAPESLSFTYSLAVCDVTKEANIWTMGVVIWELLRCGEVPYPDLSNDYVIRLVAMEKQVKPQRPLVVMDNIKYIYELMEMCWAYKVEDRPSIRELKILLLHLASSKSSNDVTFSEKWNQLKPIVSSKMSAEDVNGGGGVEGDYGGRSSSGGGEDRVENSERGGSDDDDLNINNNNNNNDDYMSDSELFGANFSNLSVLAADSTNNLSLAEELKLHIHDLNPPSPSHSITSPSHTITSPRRGDDISTPHSAFRPDMNSDFRYNFTPHLATNSDISLASGGAKSSDVSNNLNTTLDSSYMTAYDASPLTSMFEDNSLMKMRRYNDYLQTVTTSIDEPAYDVSKRKPSYEQND